MIKIDRNAQSQDTEYPFTLNSSACQKDRFFRQMYNVNQTGESAYRGQSAKICTGILEI